MMFNQFYRLVFFIICFTPAISLSKLSSTHQGENTMDRIELLKTIDPKSSERKIEQLLKFDEELDFINAFIKQHTSKELISTVITLPELLQTALKKVNSGLIVSSQDISEFQFSDTIAIKKFSFHISSPTQLINGQEFVEQFNLFILLFNSNNDDIETTYLLAEREFLFGLFPTPFPNPDVENIKNLGTAAAKTFPQSSGNFIWIYKNAFFSISNSNSNALALKVAKEFQSQIEKNVVKIDNRN